jgi:hypothetical protein
MQTGHLPDQPAITRDRCVSSGPPATVPTTPGATLDIAVGQPGTAGNTTVIVRTVADSDGSFHAVIPTLPGQSILTVPFTAGGHSIGWA